MAGSVISLAAFNAELSAARERMVRTDSGSLGDASVARTGGETQSAAAAPAPGARQAAGGPTATCEEVDVAADYGHLCWPAGQASNLKARRARVAPWLLAKAQVSHAIEYSSGTPCSQAVIPVRRAQRSRRRKGSLGSAGLIRTRTFTL
jgi:hypothetical protein